MSLPAPVAAAWTAFAAGVNVGEVIDADYERLARVAVTAAANGVGLDALQDAIIDVASKDGAPDFLAGELTAGLDVALRSLRVQAETGALAAKAAEEKSAAEVARNSALSKLSDEERKALGLA